MYWYAFLALVGAAVFVAHAVAFDVAKGLSMLATFAIAYGVTRLALRAAHRKDAK